MKSYPKALKNCWIPYTKYKRIYQNKRPIPNGILPEIASIKEVAYAQGDCAKEMEHDALLKEATAKR